MLYGRKCHALISWDQVGEHVIEGLEMIEVTNEKVVVAKEKLKEARTRKKSYADKLRRSLEFQPDCDYYEKQMVQKPMWNNAMRVNHQNSVRMTHPHSNRNVVPTAVLTRPVKHVVNKAHSPIRRPINHRPVTKNSNFNKKVTTVEVNKVNVVQGTKDNAEKALANWGNPQQALKDKGVIDSDCSRYMTGNISFLSDFEEINEGYVAFGGNPKGRMITGKGKIKTGKLDFDDVYFVKELKFNLFSVSQMCDKKKSVLFTNTECVVLSFDYKLPDENHVLLRVPRENNMYNVDLKNVVPSGDLTCLFTKATLDESNLWHKRLGPLLDDYKKEKKITGLLICSLLCVVTCSKILILILSQGEELTILFYSGR
nr:ribonuclease H-like domain-containing protein [Tanacetum cinerariifolium]